MRIFSPSRSCGLVMPVCLFVCLFICLFVVMFLDGIAQVGVGREKDGWNGMDGREWDR